MPHAISSPVKVTDPAELAKWKWSEMTVDQEWGCYAMVDLHIPESLHEKFRQLPPCPSVEVITHDRLSPYAKEALKRVSPCPRSYKAKKLITSFEAKKRYLTTHLWLKFLVDEGVIIDKVNSLYKFRQERHIQV